jgi:hypothetical protein
MTDDQIRDLLREMREEPVPADSLALVRLKVADRMRRRVRWKIGAWAVACATVLLAALFTWQGGTPAQRPAADAPGAVAHRQEALPEEPPPAIPPPAVRHAIRRTPRRVDRAPESVTIRMETADPDVVILLVSN